MKDYYQILGVEPSSSPEEIKVRYRFLALAFHPDRYTDPKLKTQAEEMMKDVNEAYSTLSDALKRSAYDRRHKQEPQASSSEPRDKQEDFGKAAFYYLEEIRVKWSPIIDTFPDDPDFNKSLSDFTDLISIVVYFRKPKVSEETWTQLQRAIVSRVFIAVAQNLYIGAEASQVGLRPSFKPEQLLLFSTMPFHFAMKDLLEKSVLDNFANKSIHDNTLERIRESIMGLCQKCQVYGGRYAASPTRPAQPTENPTKQRKRQSTQPRSYHTGDNGCMACGRNLPTRSVIFNQIIGVIYYWKRSTIEGRLCGYCIERYYWELSLKTIVFGWWGFVSFIFTPIFLILNTLIYWKSRDIRAGLPNLREASSLYRLPTIAVASILIILISPSIIKSAGYLVQLGIDTIVMNNPTPTIESRSAIPYKALKPTPVNTRPLTNKYPTRTPTRAIVRIPTRTQDPCYSWYQVTISDKGRFVCVKGIVTQAYPTQEGTYIIRFSSDEYSLRLYSANNLYYPSATSGKCVMAYGTVEVAGYVPFINITEKLLFCP